ncbi:Alba domain-containing protein [Heracleum sosnowskyi]|uniref:Alba domain-containing protein n=1 Tax=Heracleum sosnowskyi TaxID=360622 RepID=A0AAD8GR01_9APIA|nr:Alba domain-containing protein [Heracleum sosnowskyi]
MEKYQKVQKPRPQTPFNENEMRITSSGLLGNFVNYAAALFQERRGREIVLKGMGQAISKTVTIAEILKRRIPQLHQDTAIESVSIVDVWEPIEEGLLPVETSRQVSAISVTLSTEELNKDSPGYQAPAYVEQSRPRQNYQQRSQQPRQARTGYYNVVTEDAYGHGQVRGRGRGRGWNRGGYRNYEGNYRGNYQGGYQGNYRGGYQGNYRGGYQGNYPGGYLGNYPGSYQGNYKENGGYSNRSQGRAPDPGSGGYSYRGTGYGRGRGRGGGRGWQY